MTLVNFLILLLFLPVFFTDLFYFIFLWQIKEYRLDRILVHFTTWQGKQIFFSKRNLTKWLLLIFVVFSFNWVFWQWIVLVLFGGETINLLVKKQLFKFPVLTPKTIAVLVISYCLLVVGLLLPFPFYLKILLLDRGLLFLISLIFILFGILTKIYWSWQIKKARRKINLFPNLLTIGITGSYGKSSTKEFLATILKEKFKVIKTPVNQNTDIGIAQVILKELRKDHQIFVCEMAAYKKGEIAKICDMVRPQIGIITAISNQHLALFGDIRNTQEAKYELISSLPNKALAVFNAENKYCLRAATKAQEEGKKVILYAVKKVNLPGKLKNCSFFFAQRIKIFPERVEFILEDKQTRRSFSLPLYGGHNISNFLAAYSIASYLGVNLKEIISASRKILPSKTAIQVYKKDKVVLIDDSYNASPEAVLAVTNYIAQFKGQKILFLQPLIELGKEADKSHEFLAKKIVPFYDQIILTNFNYYSSFVKLISTSERQKILINPPSSYIGDLWRKGQEVVLVFEGKESVHYLEIVKKDLNL